MAERRMFAKTIIDSDAFLDMPLTTQALYFHLSMRADDDGFVNSPKKIAKMVGASDDELKLLFLKKFIIGFESGVVVIKHWRIHNYIQKDRYKETVYTEEKALLSHKENNGYTMDTDWVQIGSTGKDRLELELELELGKSKDRLELEEEEKTPDGFSLFWASYPKKEGKGQAEKSWAKAKSKKDFPCIDAILEAVDRYKRSEQVVKGFVKNPATWINGKCWLDEVKEATMGQVLSSQGKVSEKTGRSLTALEKWAMEEKR